MGEDWRLDTIFGYLERITYCNEEDNFVVARLQERGKRDLTTIIGSLVGVSPGESLKLTGSWVHSKKFGEQFRVEHFETVAPATVNAVEKYLGSGIIKGIGPIMAKRIVKQFGVETLEVIDRNPELLSMVDGIGPRRIAMISEAWQRQKSVRDIMMFLQEHGVSAAYSARIFKQYGQSSIEKVTENPYCLAADVYGIGFITADRIARNMGVDPNSVLRAKEGTLYVLRQLMDDGHVYYPYEPLLQKAAKMLEVEPELVAQAVAVLFTEKRLVLDDLDTDIESFSPNNKAVYLTPFHTAEANLARRLLELGGVPEAIALDAPRAADWVEKKLRIQLAPRQREALEMAAANKVLLITGGPGTGKTTMINALICLYRAMGLKVLLTAPTGRAAKRMQEATGLEAVTIHRLLEFSPRNRRFQRNQDRPLEADVLVVDEASMIDTLLMYDLVKALPAHIRLILVGDVDQLPSVGPGNVLRDIIDSGAFPVVVLDHIFRQSRYSRIVTNAHRINRGDFPDLRLNDPSQDSDFYFIEEEDPQKALDKIIRLCRDRIPKKLKCHPVRDIQVLTPMYRGLLGVENLNHELQKAQNPGNDGVARGSRLFRVGDKVMQILNNYDKEVFNGDIGWITAVNDVDQDITVDFDGRRLKYDFSELDELAMAYATSIHKAQGSEYPAVVIPVVMQHYLLLQRNLLYTGLTRARRMLVLVGTRKALAIAIRNNQPNHRYTRLKERLFTSRF